MGMSLLNSDRAAAAWSDNPGENLMPEEYWDRIATIADLSPREVEVCRHVFRGQTREEVAEALGLSPRTIRHHLENLHLKLRVSDRIALVLRLIQIRDYLIDDPL